MWYMWHKGTWELKGKIKLEYWESWRLINGWVRDFTKFDLSASAVLLVGLRAQNYPHTTGTYWAYRMHHRHVGEKQPPCNRG